jgi:hypothetical protein
MWQETSIPSAHFHNTLSKIIAAHRDSNGWYIVLPPADPQHKNPDLSAPFKRWARGESFGSAGGCEDNRARVISGTASDRDRSDGPTDALDYKIKLFTYAECVSTQDRRMADRPVPP